MPTPVQQQAVNDINRRLETAWNNPVTHADVNAIADRLKALPAADANAVVSELSRTGKLDQFARESTDGSILGLGGFSASERQQFFATMADRLSGPNLAAMSRALATTDRNSGGFLQVEQFGQAVAKHADPAAKLEFVRQLAPATTDKPNYAEATFGASFTHSSDAEAAAVGDVLGSMRGANAEAGFRALAPDQLRAVMRSGIDGEITTSTSGMSATNVLSYNTSSFTALSKAAASVGDADLKARIFDAGATTLRDVQRTGNVLGGLTVVGRDTALNRITEGLTRVLTSDTAGVTRELAYNSETMGGTAFASYAKQMLGTDAGREALGKQLAQLQYGNDLQGDVIARLNTPVNVPGTNPPQARRENAGALGYFVGGTYAAARSITSDVKAQQEAVTAVLDSALTVFDKFTPWGKPTGVAASVAKEWTQYAVRAAIRDPGDSAANQLERAALPVNPATGELGVGDNVLNAFGVTLERTIRQARP